MLYKSMKVANFYKACIKEICGLDQYSQIKIPDFGCGDGNLVKDLLSLDYDAKTRDLVFICSKGIKE